MRWTIVLNPREEVTIQFNKHGHVDFEVINGNEEVLEGLITTNQDGPVSGVSVIDITDDGMEPANATILVGDALVWQNDVNRTVQVPLC